jgi:phage terminase large subunit-like protein
MTDESRGLKAIRWIEKYCRVPEGKHFGEPLVLAPFMREDLIAIYDNPHGTRRAILSRGRKNAKTTESALLTLLHLCGPMYVRNGQIFSAAQGLEQAAILFKLACKIIRLSPVLQNSLDIRESKKEIFCPALGTLYRALSAETSTAYGLSPVLVIHDELGQVRGPTDELYEALETATAAQENPLSVVISTQARTDNDLLSILIDDALEGHDRRTIIRLHSADKELDPFSDEAMRAANPAFDVFMNADEVRSMAADAKRMSGRENDFRNLVLNQRVDASTPFVSTSQWRACGDPPAPLEQCAEVYGGLDLSSVKDLTALVFIGKVDGRWQVEPHFWLPGEGLADKSRLDRTPFDTWAREGYLHTTPNKTVDYDFVVDRLMEYFDRYKIKKIAFDRWNFAQFKPYLIRAGMSEDMIKQKFSEFGQGFRSMSPALAQLERAVANGRLAHGNHPVLQMCSSNSTVTTDPAGNRKLVKKRYYGRIDGMVALAMAIGVTSVAEVERKFTFAVLG